MQKKSMPRMSMFAIPLMIACGLLVSIASARADSNCSNQTLHGDYGSTIEGEILGFGPVRGVAMAHFDGKGNMTQVDHVVVNGILPALQWTPGFGTYTVNPDCTGTGQINIPGSPFSPVNLHFVVVRQGKEIRTVVDANAVTSVGIRRD
jgi:hypothetical protein